MHMTGRSMNVQRFVRHARETHAVVFVLSLLMFAAFPAFADGPKCAPFSAAASGFKVTLAPTANLTRWVNNTGAYYVTSWWCSGKYAPSGWYYVGTRAALPANFLTELQKVPAASLDQLLAAQTQYMTKALSPEQTAAGLAQLAASRPVSPVWLVAKNSSYPDRPMYAVANGVMGATAIKDARAVVGAVCACDLLALEIGTASYCPVAGTPTDLTKVALCKQ